LGGSAGRLFKPHARPAERPNTRIRQRRKQPNAFLPRPEGCLTSTRHLATYYFWYFAAVGVFEPYLTAFWRQIGFSSAQIGLLNSITPGVAAFAPFLWTAYADATRQGERIFLVNTWISALVAFLIPNLEGLLAAATAVLAFALFRTALIPLANSMTFRALADRRQGFAAVRLWGTIGYIVTAVGSGIVMDGVSLWAGLHGIALAMVGCGFMAWLVQGERRVVLPAVRLTDVLQLLHGRQLMLLLVASAMARMSFGPYQTFFTIHVERLGLSRTFAGTAWALAAASELVVMLCWARMCERTSARTWLIAALASFPLRWTLSAFAHGPFLLLVAQLTHAFTFGVFYLAAVQTVDGLVPDGLRASAQGLHASITFGLGDLLGNALAGILYEPLGMARLYGAATLLSAAATLLYWAGARQAAATCAIAGIHVSGNEPR
jgi:PPP family 3-phenylpropionic acid transporter